MSSFSNWSTVTALDSPILGGSLTDEKMREAFSAGRFLHLCIDVEVALARAQGALGLIPREAAEAIAHIATDLPIDMDLLRRESEIVGYPILPLVHQLAAAAGEAGRYVHWGATTQDIMDTATVLQVRSGLLIIRERLDAVRAALRRLALQHRDTPMAGRTHLQHALPITFGYKAAVWLSALDRHVERLSQVEPRVLVGQLSGAAGSLASLGAHGLEVQRSFCQALGLAVPPITWHSARDGLTECVQLMALIAASLAKVAVDVSIMMMTEIGEVAEPFSHLRGSSSTMPQKRNPISCELMIAVAKLVRQHSGLMLDAAVHDFERATGPWHLEWIAVPESFALTGGALVQAELMLSGLQVHPDIMRRNLNHTGGLIVSEAAMMALAPHVGRQRAHELVYDCCRLAIETGRPLREVLGATDEVTRCLSRESLDGLMDPANYLGAAPQMVDRILTGR